MNVLVLGGTGFIGSHLTNALLLSNYQVTLGVRNSRYAKLVYPQLACISCDFTKDIEPSTWAARLDGIDAIINCVGVLEEKSQDMHCIHHLTPKAVFTAAQQKNIRVIHISAMGADAEAPTLYATTKYAAEEELRKLDFPWTIFRPSLLYSYGSYGGTSVLRGLAGLPCITPIIGDGKQTFQPIHLDDLIEAIINCLENPECYQQTIDAVGPEAIEYATVVTKIQQWLRFPATKHIHMPMGLMLAFAPVAQLLMPEIPLNKTALKMLDYGYVSQENNFEKLTKVKPKTMEQGLLTHPSHVQDRWHARIYMLEPLLRISLALVWVISGILPFISKHAEYTATMYLNQIPYFSQYATSILYGFSSVDFFLGMCLLFSRSVRVVLSLQILFMAFFSIVACLYMPNLLVDPFVSLVKNMTIISASIILFFVYDQR